MTELNIIATTVHLKPPLLLENNRTGRKALEENTITKELILFEEVLRRSAYKNTNIKTGEAFFNDSDMIADYYLVVVYDKISNTPLLSCRYYFDGSLIEKYSGNIINMRDHNKGEIFLADRLSGNPASSVYRHFHTEVFAAFYKEILNYNKHCKLILMARKEKQDKLLNKYLQLGFKIMGTTIHQNKEHWVILRDLKDV